MKESRIKGSLDEIQSLDAVTIVPDAHMRLQIYDGHPDTGPAECGVGVHEIGGDDAVESDARAESVIDIKRQRF